jgi:hypothetical protein
VRSAILVCLTGALASCATSPASLSTQEPSPPDLLGDVTIPPRPDWTDPYAASNTGDMRFFDIDALMARHGLSRALAVELQNHYRDASRSDPNDTPTVWFEVALAKAKNAEFEDRRDLARLEQAAFVVVFDLDETLHDQYYAAEVGAQCHDLAIEGESAEGPRHVKLTPGWAEAISRIDALGGAVVLFSANKDDLTWENLSQWKLEDTPIHEHPHISGVLTNSHLILQQKSAGKPVVEPSKDLRIIDPDLTKVILVDDNPGRAFQFRNLRVIQKFDADVYCTTEDETLRRAFDSALPAVITEIEDAAQAMRARNIGFAAAYLPYSVLGRVAVGFLVETGMSEREAIEWVREHPEVVPTSF